jgi:hypothetical protein
MADIEWGRQRRCCQWKYVTFVEEGFTKGQ